MDEELRLKKKHNKKSKSPTTALEYKQAVLGPGLCKVGVHIGLEGKQAAVRNIENGEENKKHLDRLEDEHWSVCSLVPLGDKNCCFPLSFNLFSLLLRTKPTQLREGSVGGSS